VIDTRDSSFLVKTKVKLAEAVVVTFLFVLIQPFLIYNKIEMGIRWIKCRIRHQEHDWVYRRSGRVMSDGRRSPGYVMYDKPRKCTRCGVLQKQQ